MIKVFGSGLRWKKLISYLIRIITTKTMKIKTWSRMSHRPLTFRHIVMVFWCYKRSVFNFGCSLILFVVVVVVSFVEAKKKGRRKASKNQSIPEDLGKVTWIVVTGLEFDDSWKFYSFSNNSDQYGLHATDVGDLLRLSKLVDRFTWLIHITVHRLQSKVRVRSCCSLDNKAIVGLNSQSAIHYDIYFNFLWK